MIPSGAVVEQLNVTCRTLEGVAEVGLGDDPYVIAHGAEGQVARFAEDGSAGIQYGQGRAEACAEPVEVWSVRK